MGTLFSLATLMAQYIDFSSRVEVVKEFLHATAVRHTVSYGASMWWPRGAIAALSSTMIKVYFYKYMYTYMHIYICYND